MDGAGNGVWRLFGDWLDVVWGLGAVCWRLVAGFVRSGGPRIEDSWGIRGFSTVLRPRVCAGRGVDHFLGLGGVVRFGIVFDCVLISKRLPLWRQKGLEIHRRSKGRVESYFLFF